MAISRGRPRSRPHQNATLGPVRVPAPGRRPTEAPRHPGKDKRHRRRLRFFQSRPTDAEPRPKATPADSQNKTCGRPSTPARWAGGTSCRASSTVEHCVETTGVGCSIRPSGTTHKAFLHAADVRLPHGRRAHRPTPGHQARNRDTASFGLSHLGRPPSGTRQLPRSSPRFAARRAGQLGQRPQAPNSQTNGGPAPPATPTKGKRKPNP